MGFLAYSEGIKSLATQLAIEGVPLTEINLRLQTDISKVLIYQWKQLFYLTNHVVADPATYKHRGRPFALSNAELATLYDLVVDRPSIYLDELQKELRGLTGLDISRATLNRELHKRLGLSLLVTRGVHPNQSLEARMDFKMRVAGIPPECLVFIDESGVVGRNASQKRSYAKRGSQTVRQKRPTKRAHWTLLPAVSKQGMIAGVVIEGPVRRIDVKLFLKHDLLPVMNLYPAAKSVLIMDNACVHHGGRILELCRRAGILVFYLPAYSPDMNPIENRFHCTKAQLKQEDRWMFEDDKANYLLLLAARVMTQSLIQPLIAHSGYTTRHYWNQYNARFDDEE